MPSDPGGPDEPSNPGPEITDVPLYVRPDPELGDPLPVLDNYDFPSVPRHSACLAWRSARARPKRRRASAQHSSVTMRGARWRSRSTAAVARVLGMMVSKPAGCRLLVTATLRFAQATSTTLP